MLKRYLFLLVSLIAMPALFAQTQRMVLIEEATNASCGPCASQNPAFMALLNQNRDKLTAVMYHWYFPGFDPMHLHNVAENNARVSFYGINGVPTAVIDGVIPSGAGFSYPGGPHGFTQALIDQYHAVPSPFEIDVYHYLSPDEEYIHVVARITAAQDIEGNFRAHLVVVEKLIEFSSPPGSNGETTFHDVMKKMLPNHLGTPIKATWEAGEYIIIEESWKLANIYDMDQLGVVGFIQESPSKSVQQAANSEPEPFTAYFDTDAAITDLTNLTETNCSGVLSPVITIANYGSDVLTSAMIVYEVNGSVQTWNWTGSLDYLQSEVIELPEISFPVLITDNQLIITLDDPNGTDDGYPQNNTIIRTFDAAIGTPSEVKLTIILDSNPEEITWEVTNMDDEVVFSGGPYANPGQTITEIMTFEDNGCYLFTIYDAGGDGIQAPGFFVLYHGTNNQILSGTNFGSMARAQFDVGFTVDVPVVEVNDQISIFPNPMHSSGIAEFMLTKTEQVEITVHNMVGQLVKTVANSEFNPGLHRVDIHISDLDAGLYIINARVGNEILTKKITVIR